MNCTFDKEKLSGYYDGELAAAEKAEVERHIASCSECLRDLGDLKSAALLVKELPRLRAPKSIAEGVSREIQAAGKVHSLAKFRRGVLWASAAAAGIFIVMNAMYLSSQKTPPPASAPIAACDNLQRERSLAKVEPETAAKPVPPPAPSARAELRSAAPAADQEMAARRQLETRKDAGEGGEKRTTEEVAKADAQKAKTEAPKPGETLAKGDGKAELPLPAPAAPAPVPPTAKPAAAAPAAEPPRPESAPLADKAKPAKEAEMARKPDEELKAKMASAGAPAELKPAQYNVVTKEIAKARPRIEESLKKMGLTMPAPPSQPMKQPRNREAENMIVLELTDVQLAQLHEDLEKPGDARMVPASSLEPVLPAFGKNGLFAKKESAAGGKGPSTAAAKEKDVKEQDDAAAGPRRKVTLHLIESKNLPPAADDPVPQK
jgi:hypothetical protein